MRQITLIAHDIRSTHNVGSLLRTAEGLGAEKIFFTGYTPYPRSAHDPRLPHIAQKLDAQIHKTALDAETIVPWQHEDDVQVVLDTLRAAGYNICALEQAKTAIPLPQWQPSNKVAILIGREVEGIEPALLKQADTIVEIPMFGKKESFNVVQATAMLLYHCRFSETTCLVHFGPKKSAPHSPYL
ncbi:MAG: TrmH family RNA methyltransferase [Candidatus Saccharimonadales bacterium]